MALKLALPCPTDPLQACLLAVQLAKSSLRAPRFDVEVSSDARQPGVPPLLLPTALLQLLPLLLWAQLLELRQEELPR